MKKQLKQTVHRFVADIEVRQTTRHIRRMNALVEEYGYQFRRIGLNAAQGISIACMLLAGGRLHSISDDTVEVKNGLGETLIFQQE